MARRSSAPRRYAEAAFEVAMRDDTIAAWRSDLELAAGLVGDPRATAVLANPAIPVERRAEATSSMLGERISTPARNLVQLMLRRGRIEDLPRVAAEFRRLDDERQGITHATAVSATELTADEVRALTQRLEQSTGGRIALQVDVDPDLLGGIVVRVGDRMIDGSVRGRLERLRNQLISGAL
ncbi:MAG TPA: ATP synthase F1 subunit delta [Candidatus Limnocylindrales bacterium]|jgi:F-type H+-transporting ATPase subunit delta|nr:ATP synthase F1 subunit delta [Candidatus Limnocylindrales bacterium]